MPNKFFSAFLPGRLRGGSRGEDGRRGQDSAASGAAKDPRQRRRPAPTQSFSQSPREAGNQDNGRFERSPEDDRFGAPGKGRRTADGPSRRAQRERSAAEGRVDAQQRSSLGFAPDDPRSIRRSAPNETRGRRRLRASARRDGEDQAENAPWLPSSQSGGAAPARLSSRPIQPVSYAANNLGLSEEMIPPGAMRVIRGLQSRGHEAFLVGGCVRDLLLGKRPKDFDVATSATPQQVRSLFRRSYIIGRRFRIVKVCVGPEEIEVTTYRSGLDYLQNADGRITEDNDFGDQTTDCFRRDFSCNALYYDPAAGEVRDYCGGVLDIRDNKLVMIGDPRTRMREDPVRALRAIRLSCKLGLLISDPVVRVLPEILPLLQKEPPARLSDEFLKILSCGAARDCVEFLLMLPFDLSFNPFLAYLKQRLASEDETIGLLDALDFVDGQVKRNGAAPSAGFIYAVLAWAPVRDSYLRQTIAKGSQSVAMQSAANEFCDLRFSAWHVTKRASLAARDLWMTHFSMARLKKNRVLYLLRSPNFKDHMLFLEFREQRGEISRAAARRWRQIAAMNAQQLDFELVSAPPPVAGDAVLDAAWKIWEQSVARPKRQRPNRRASSGGGRGGEARKKSPPKAEPSGLGG